MSTSAIPQPASPSTGSVAVVAASRELRLLPQRALLDTASRSLMVADLHLGKAATFRAHGLPVPSGTTERTLARLDALLAGTAARSLFLLGDLLHAPEALRPSITKALADWRARHARVEVILVRGNHDARAGKLPAGCGIDTVAPGHRLGELRLLHEPPGACDLDPPASRVDAPRGDPSCDDQDRPATHWIAGHLHPVARLGRRADALRLPCFWQRPAGVVLPAFGEFTGGWPVVPAPADRLHVTDGERVLSLPPRRRYGSRTIGPEVCLDSSARCASAAAASG